MRSGVLRIGAPTLLAIVVVGMIVATCDSAGRSGSAGGSAGAPVSPGPTAGATGTPAPATGTPAATPSSSSDPAATASTGPSAATGTSATAGLPPSATLAADGGDPTVGQLGSYTWLDGGSDSPWLPGTPLTVGPGEPLTVAIGGGVAVADWSARRVTAGRTDGSGAIALGAAGGPPVAFAAPGTGTWSVQVTVRFANDLGSAAYYWRLTVR
jgi:hypothetical protein